MFDIIALDLDGTLLRGDKTVSEESLKTLKEFEAMGKQIVIATARPPRMGSFKLPEELQKEYMIFYNGAEIHHNRQKIFELNIPLASAQKMRDLIVNEGNDWNIGYEIENNLYTNFRNDGIFGTNEYDMVELASFELRATTKILIDMRSVVNVELLKRSLPSDCYMVITDNGELGQIMAKGVNKVNALKFIVQRIGTSMEKVIFFGDDTNDIELIRECGIGVAMGNANRGVKDIADHVTLSNEEDGIAVFLRRFL